MIEPDVPHARARFPQRMVRSAFYTVFAKNFFSVGHRVTGNPIRRSIDG